MTTSVQYLYEIQTYSVDVYYIKKLASDMIGNCEKFDTEFTAEYYRLCTDNYNMSKIWDEEVLYQNLKKISYFHNFSYNTITFISHKSLH